MRFNGVIILAERLSALLFEGHCLVHVIKFGLLVMSGTNEIHAYLPMAHWSSMNKQVYLLQHLTGKWNHVASAYSHNRPGTTSFLFGKSYAGIYQTA